ncbi:McrB family protein [Viridibacillus arvi]|uniref:McrB family protein n=1 Tax=Viridibacillus arvi TaxID=263475 RepID=UPI003D04E3EB
MAYSSEVGKINVDVLQDSLRVTRKGAEVVFQSDELFIISPSIQNGSNWFDIRNINRMKFIESGKKGLLILRHNNSFLISDLNEFGEEMMKDEYLKNTSTGGAHWKFNIISGEGLFAVYNQANRNILYTMKCADKEKLAIEAEKLIKKIIPYSLLIKDGEKSTVECEGAEIKSILPYNAISHIHKYINSKGFFYTKENIKNLYLSLRSKPFVIISGISGTGKTKIAQLFAESIGATKDNGQFKLIPVRPDWSDSSDLIGYTDLKGDFIKGPLTQMVERAIKNPNAPHFILLDEMNLARVEYYFSDVLSVMESRSRETGDVTSSPLISNEDFTLHLPGNLYIIGTVNMDETTHPFSKKVLDRANTIEFNEINLLNFPEITTQEKVEPIRISNELLQSKYIHLIDLLHIKDASVSDYEPPVKEVVEKLVSINTQLEKIHAQVGYRVRDEICFYMAYNDESQLLPKNEAFDFCIMQKILPRISGSGDRIENVLKVLYQQFTNEVYVRETEVQDTAPYRLSAKKTSEMLRRLEQDGFTSFWIS